MQGLGWLVATGYDGSDELAALHTHEIWVSVVKVRLRPFSDTLGPCLKYCVSHALACM